MAAVPVVVTGDTSLVLIDTQALTANQAAVVLLSNVQDPGRTVTIRDSIGFLSTPQSIVVSTMSGVSFADGTSSVSLTQPFTYLTVTSRDSASWNVTNSFGFPQSELIANAFSLTTNTVTTSNLYASSLISTTLFTARDLRVQSTAAVLGPMFTSTFVASSSNPTTYRPYVTDPGYIAYIGGNLKSYGSLVVDGAAQFQNTISTGGNFTVTGNISSIGSLGVQGDILALGNIFATRGGASFRTLNVTSSANIQGPVTFSNILFINSNLIVASTLSTTALTASTVSVGSQLTFAGGKYILARSSDIFVSDPLAVSSFTTGTATVSNILTASTLQIYQTLDARSASSFTLGSAAIENPGGSLLISSISANTGDFITSISSATVGTSSLAASTLLLSGNLQTTASGSIGIGVSITSTLSTGTVATNTVESLTLRTSSLQTSSLVVSYQVLGASGLGLISLPSTTILNQGGSITTNTITADALTAASTLTVTAGQITSGVNPLTFITPLMAATAGSISSLTTSSLATSSLTATSMILGGQTNPYTNGPTFTVDLTSFTSTNVVITGGPGDVLTPFTVSNVKPADIYPGEPYFVEASFRLNFNGPYLPGYYARVPALSLIPNGVNVSQVTLKCLDDASTITTLYGIYGSNQTFSTDATGNGVAIPIGALPSSFFHLTGTMVDDSQFSFSFQSLSNVNYSRLDSNANLTIENGVLQWPYSLNATTIQNSLNDMSIRNIYYYGSLNFASDPAVKEVLGNADLDRCAAIVEQLPLRRFKYIDAYLSAFNVRDARRLGFLATEMETFFPKSVQTVELEGFSTIRMIDTQQVEFAHFGATKQLLSRVGALESTIGALRSELSTLLTLG